MAGVVILATGGYVLGAVVLIVSLVAIGVILSDRNSWLRAPLGRGKRSDSTDPPDGGSA